MDQVEIEQVPQVQVQQENQPKVIKKYTKLVDETKLNFLKSILIEKQSMKDAAKQFNIKLSTAKAIFKKYRESGDLNTVCKQKKIVLQENDPMIDQDEQQYYLSLCQQWDSQVNDLRQRNSFLEQQIELMKNRGL